MTHKNKVLTKSLSPYIDLVKIFKCRIKDQILGEQQPLPLRKAASKISLDR